MLLSLRTLSLGFWFGAGIATIFATRAVFRTLPERKVAGDVSGEILRAALWGRLGWAVPFLASALAPRDWHFWLGCGALGFALVQFAVDRYVRALRAQGSKKFGPWHGVSVLLLLAHVVCAGAALL